MLNKSKLEILNECLIDIRKLSTLEEKRWQIYDLFLDLEKYSTAFRIYFRGIPTHVFYNEKKLSPETEMLLLIYSYTQMKILPDPYSDSDSMFHAWKTEDDLTLPSIVYAPWTVVDNPECIVEGSFTPKLTINSRYSLITPTDGLI